MVGKLQGTPYGNDGYIETLREEFDEDAKCLFRAVEEGGDDVYGVRIAGRGDDFEDESGLCNIELGYLNVDRCEFFFCDRIFVPDKSPTLLVETSLRPSSVPWWPQ